MSSKPRNFLERRALAPLLVFLFLSAIYLYAFPQANVFYAGVVLAHALAGVVASVYLAIFLFRLLRGSSVTARLGWILIAASAVVGLVLLKLGTARSELDWLYLHILVALVGSG